MVASSDVIEKIGKVICGDRGGAEVIGGGLNMVLKVEKKCRGFS